MLKIFVSVQLTGVLGRSGLQSGFRPSYGTKAVMVVLVLPCRHLILHTIAWSSFMNWKWSPSALNCCCFTPTFMLPETYQCWTITWHHRSLVTHRDHSRPSCYSTYAKLLEDVIRGVGVRYQLMTLNSMSLYHLNQKMQLRCLMWTNKLKFDSIQNGDVVCCRPVGSV